ncbi:hypothetical protein M422DRAFT_256068 [Sphaerobolus stellatus SS14]|uniref:Uncharacterized protein n=1 Tax=Sphaerobolus stellatus (strain SS14) TaxID=990650 RepID=A0A0C9VHM6_SPHS4|nr:hypothetical protein M422DRAFT_256068 [Sphaerobolus stellatus SS14]
MSTSQDADSDIEMLENPPSQAGVTRKRVKSDNASPQKDGKQGPSKKKRNIAAAPAPHTTCLSAAAAVDTRLKLAAKTPSPIGHKPRSASVPLSPQKGSQIEEEDLEDPILHLPEPSKIRTNKEDTALVKLFFTEPDKGDKADLRYCKICQEIQLHDSPHSVSSYSQTTLNDSLHRAEHG